MTVNFPQEAEFRVRVFGWGPGGGRQLTWREGHELHSQMCRAGALKESLGHT